MAERRMFAKSVVQSSRFLKMPVSSRELYFQMGMSADDDGVVDAWNIMRLTDAREDDLRVLVAKGFIQILNNEDMIAYLTDWDINNTIRKDRYHEGVYKNLKIQVLELLDNQVATNGQPADNQMTPEVRLGKDSIGKDSIGYKNIVSQSDGRARFIPPTVDQVREYCLERNNSVDAETFVDFYTGKGWMVGKNKMKDWKAAVRIWEKSRTTIYQPARNSGRDFIESVARGDIVIE